MTEKSKPRKTVTALPARKLTKEHAKAVRGGVKPKHLAGIKYNDFTVAGKPK